MTDKTKKDLYGYKKDEKKRCFCNKCGKEFDLWDAQEDFSIRKSLGYGTKYDGMDLDIHLCCDCMEKLIDECTFSPIFDSTKTKR